MNKNNHLEERPSTDNSIISKSVGVVLNGGQSRRMGTAKGELEFQGRKLIDHAISSLALCELDTIYISLAKGEQAQHCELNYISDSFSDKGPVSGILSVVEQAELTEGDIVVIVPNDMPKMQASFVEYLWKYSISEGRSCYFENYFLPLSLRLTKPIMQALQNVKLESSCSIRSLLNDASSLGLDRLPVDAKDNFINVNSMLELRELAK